MSQFEKDLHLAIQQSLEEERKKQEVLNQNQKSENNNSNPQVENDIKETPGVNKDIKMDIEEDEEAELEKARLMSIQEHDMLLKKKDDEESKID